MYILKNALKNIGRNKGRNILLGIIIFVLILSTTAALVINSTTKGIIDDYKTRFGSKITLSVDFDKLMSEQKPNADGILAFPEAPVISSEQYMSFAESEYLKSYHMDMLAGVALEELEAVDEKANDGMAGSIGGSADDEYISPEAKLLGYSDTNNLPDFTDGLRKIIEGSLFKNKNECLISSDFADLNGLKTGDSFVVKDTASKKNVMLTVAGVYADATKASDVPQGSFSLEGSYGNRRNEILVGLETMTANFSVNDLSVNAEYELKTPDLVKDFEKELREKGLPAVYNVETDEANYNKIVAPVVGLSKISMAFMWVILVVGGIILLFITSMAIRERKYEIGVLRAMGMKKSKVAIMLVIETVMITVLCLGAGLGIGSALSQPIADSLIAGQVKAVENQPTQNGSINGAISIGGAGEPDIEPLKEIDVSLTPETALQIMLIALALALLSSSTGVIFITKYEPTKILWERN